MAQGKPWPSLMGSVALGTPRFLSCEVGTIGPHSTPPPVVSLETFSFRDGQRTRC